MALTPVLVTGKYLSTDGLSADAPVRLSATPPVKLPGEVHIYPVAAKLKAAGEFELHLFADSASALVYSVDEWLGSGRRTLTVTVPAGASGELALKNLTGYSQPAGRSLSVRGPVTPAPVSDATKEPYIPSRLSDAALRAAFVSSGQARDSVALLGDSITANNYPVNAFAGSYNNDGYWTWAAMRLRGRLRLAGVFGYAGQQIATIAGHVPDALASGAGTVFVLAGTNDASASRSFAQMRADMLALLVALKAGGVRIVVGTIPPLQAWTAGQKTAAYQYNAWLLAYGRANGITVVDWSSVLADPSTGLPLAGVLHADGIHPQGMGAALMGQRLANALAPVVPAIDVQSTGGDPNIIHTNPAMFSGSPIATGWSLFDTAFGTSGARAGCVPTKVARTDDVPGSWQQVVVTDASGVVLISPVMSTGFAVGDTLTGSVEFERNNDWTAMGTTAAAFRVSIQTQGFTSYGANHIAGDTYPTAYLPLSGVIPIPPFVVPAGATSVKVVIEWAGQGTLRVGRTEMRKVTAP